MNITANRRRERAQDVAGSVNAIVGGRLEELNAQTLNEFASFVPGVQVIADQPGHQQVSIRGITTGIIQSSATVATYLDESPISFNSNFANGSLLSPDPDALDLERIEILKGPQGSLYGASALGGLIKYVTILPDLRSLGGKAEVGLDKISGGGVGHIVRGALNVPIVTDSLAARVSVFSRHEAGYLDNVATGRNNINGFSNEGVRASVLWKSPFGLTARLSAEEQHIHVPDGSQLEVDAATLKPAYGDLKVAYKFPQPTNQDSDRTSLQLNYDLGFANLQSVTSYLKVRQQFTVDYTNAYGPFLAAPFGGDTIRYGGPTDNRKATQEFRLTSPSGGRFEWLAGYYYTYERSQYFLDLDVLSGPAGGPFAPIAPGLITAGQDATLREKAVYGNATYKITDTVDLQGGLRYSLVGQNIKEINQVSFGAAKPDSQTDSDEHEITWMLSPRWKLSRDQMVYLRAANGYRPGGPNNVAFAPSASPTFKSDKIVNYEVGFKGALPSANVDYTAALFRINWREIQLFGIDPVTGLGFYANGGKAHSQGVELEGGWRPISGLRLSGSGAFTDAKIDEDVPIPGVAAKKGDKIPYTPRFAAALNADYSFEFFGGWQSSVGISERYVGQRSSYLDAQRVGLGVQIKPADLPSYNLVDVRAAFSKDVWTLGLFVKNVFDKRGALSLNGINVGAGTTPGSSTPAGLAIAQPRTFGVTLRADF